MRLCLKNWVFGVFDFLCWGPNMCWRLNRSCFLLMTCFVVMVLSLACKQEKPATKGPTGGDSDGGQYGLSAELPEAVPGFGDVAGEDENPDNLQAKLDEFAWAAFIYLNWPANADGTPNAKVVIGGDPGAPRVWEYFVDPVTIFPEEEDACERPPKSNGPGDKVMHRKMFRKGMRASEDRQAAPTWPLIDRNQNYVINEVRLNQKATEYITKTAKIATAQGFQDLKNSGGSVAFPNGSIEIKAAWRIFNRNTPPEELARYYSRKTNIFVSCSESESGQSFVLKQIRIGLIGLHVNYKAAENVPGRPGWTWATFEQVDNYQVGHDAPPGLLPSFNGGDHPSEPNRQPHRLDGGEDTYLWTNIQVPGHEDQALAAGYQSSLVVSSPNAVDPPVALNKSVQKQLAQVAGSPWQFYRLNGNQWYDRAGKVYPQKAGVPTLRNAVLETYMIGDKTAANTLAQEVHGDPPPPNYPLTTLDHYIVAQTNVEQNNVIGENTWSTCAGCHLLSLFQFRDLKVDNPTVEQLNEVSMLTDYSMVFRGFLKQQLPAEE